MKYNFSARLFGFFYHSATKKELAKNNVGKATLKEIKSEYKSIVTRAKDIGKANLISSYFMAAYFIALNRKDGFDSEKNYQIFHDGLLSSKLFKKVMGSGEHYFDEERTKKRKIWAKESKKKKYENDWVLDVLDKTDDYDLGYNYYECGVCKLCADEKCPELAKYLCRLDFPIADMMGMKLERTMTLAEGGKMCDFRYSKKDN